MTDAVNDAVNEGSMSDSDALGVAVGETMALSSVDTSLVPSLAGTSGSQRLAGRYELLGLLGAGGMGMVYRARDIELDELVALKVLQAELVDSPDMLARFRQEAKLARRVTHRNVARTFDIGEHGGVKFLTMELVDGESLASLVARRGSLPIVEVLRIVQEVCAGMTAAHAAGVVHRDLKPDNVLIARDGRVVVTDFGIAHAAAGSAGAVKTLGGIVGTPAYMAPEQVEGAADIDARADLYALGAMVYELLTGQRPWPGDAPFVVAAARLANPPPDPRAILPDLPRAVAEVVLRCMARKREDRYGTADEVARAYAEAVAVGSTPSAALAQPRVASRPPPRESREGAADRSTDKTIAVLPFKNGGPLEDEYLADGITDDLIDVLSMTPGLKVRPRGAVSAFRGVDCDPRQAGRDLNVQVVALGSVRRTATQIRVTARLVSTADGFQLWAKRFDRPAADALAVNDEAAAAIAEALTLEANAKPRVAPTDPVAIDLYLRATAEFRKFWRPDVIRAVELYEQALVLAPHDATILAACARARVRVAFYGGDDSVAILGRAMQAAELAVAGAPDIGESWLALASGRMMSGDAPGAVRALVTALDRAKGLAPAHDLMGRILIEAGCVDAALHHLRMAISIDPSEGITRFELARAHALLGNWAESDVQMAHLGSGTQERIARYLFRARLCLWRGEPHPDLNDPPVAGPEMGALANPQGFVQLLQSRELAEGMREMLEDGVKRVAKGSRRRILFAQINAEIFAYTFEIDHAFEALAQAIDSGLVDVLWMDRCPLFAAVRGDARFAPLRAVVNERAQLIVAALGVA